MANWKDATSYSRADKERTPRVWELQDGRLRILLHRIHDIPDAWFVSCYLLQISDKALKAKDIEGAKKEAIAIVKKAFNELADSFKRLLKE